MREPFINIPGQLNIPASIPLSYKEYAILKSDITSLGTNDYLAYQYYKGLRIFCIENRCIYEWMPVEEAGNLLKITPSFTYGNNYEVNDIDYSNKEYGLFLVQNEYGILNIETGGDENTIINNLSIPEWLPLENGQNYSLPKMKKGDRLAVIIYKSLQQGNPNEGVIDLNGIIYLNNLQEFIGNFSYIICIKDTPENSAGSIGIHYFIINTYKKPQILLYNTRGDFPDEGTSEAMQGVIYIDLELNDFYTFDGDNYNLVADIVPGTLQDVTTFLDTNNQIVIPANNIIYVDTSTDTYYRWNGTSYEEVFSATITESFYSPGLGIVFNPTQNGEEITLDLDVRELVSPIINSSWVILKEDGITQIGTSSNNNLIVDKGSKVNYSGIYYYPNANINQKNPTATSGNWGSILPLPGVPSNSFTLDEIIVNTTISQTLSAPQSGLIVENGKVKFPSGNETKKGEVKLEFLGRGGVILSENTSLTSGQIEAEINEGDFWPTKNRTINNVDPGANEYTYIVYDNSLGNLNDIKLNGVAPILGAFQLLGTVSTTNKAGATYNVKVYRSNAKDAFNNDTLVLS